MNLYAQHGWGKGDKLRLGIQQRHISGVILSPHDETPEALAAIAHEAAQSQQAPDVMMDPQVYVSLIQDANVGRLPQYPYYHSGLSIRDFTTPRNVQLFVREAIDFQRQLEVTHIISPTIIQDGFTDRSSQIALSLAQESVDYWDGIAGDRRPLLLSLVFSENSLSSPHQVADFLNTITLFEADGFYLVVDRNDAIYSQDFQSGRLTEFLKVIFSLARARFHIVCGYSDFVGLVYAAAGAHTCATGWSQRLRRFNSARFVPTGWGRPPRDRYSSSPLLNSIFMTELDACQDAGRLNAVLSNTAYDRPFDGRTYPSGVSWSPQTGALHHWAAISSLAAELTAGTTRERVQKLSQRITQAQTIYLDLARRGVTFEPPNGPNHLTSWGNALAAFRAAFRI